MNTRTKGILLLAFLSLGGILSLPGLAGEEPGETPNLERPRITQSQIAGGSLKLRDIRLAGLRMFTTPFNKLDGYGDGPVDPSDTLSPGGRPTLQGNGTFLRLNGLDAQTCLECHSLLSAATVPTRLGIGGVGGSNSNAVIMPTKIDPADLGSLSGKAAFNGRFANPPFLFGAGGVELLALEMTADLQAFAAKARANPGTTVALVTKGVDFGEIVADADGDLDTSDVEGVDPDLVVRPFGRKGEFATIRRFDVEAVQFHFGMQPVEVVGAGVDGDGDGVRNEVLPGELSALHTFATTLERPQAKGGTRASLRGFASFRRIGCADCHIPALDTRSIHLPLRFPEVETDPSKNVYLKVDLTARPVSFRRNRSGGVRVPLFADLKRHDMGAALAEDFALADEERNRSFTTARLWGIADTAPYLHDGRATTLTEAILLHGGEASNARNAFDALSANAKKNLLAFLRTLRVPEDPARDLLETQNRKKGPSKGKKY